MFHNLLTRARQTRASHPTAAVRLLLGLLFLATGAMKFVVPELRAAFSGQLVAASIPFHALNIWLVPAAELVVGALFSLGLLARRAHPESAWHGGSRRTSLPRRSSDWSAAWVAQAPYEGKNT